MADLSGDSAQPAIAVLGPEADGAGGRRVARSFGGTGGRLLRARPSASASSAAPRTPAASARGKPTAARSPRCISSPALCLVAGILPGIFIDALAPVVQLLVGGRMPVQIGGEWLSIVPIAESRSSYNGLLVFVFMALSGALAAFAIHRLASDRLRRGPAWDCGYPDPSPLRNTARTVSPSRSAACSAPACSAPARSATCRRPARRAGASHRRMRDLIWDLLYAPMARFVDCAADRLNELQFLTIRSYLTLVFAALVLLLLVLAIWP